jgi:DNA-binding transcriptional MerR regulator
MAKGLISTQEIIKKHNLSYQTVNYYTNLGLLSVRKKIGNSRFYGAGEVRRRLEAITKFKNQGYSLKLIRDLLRK